MHMLDPNLAVFNTYRAISHDISFLTRYAGEVFGIANCLATIPGMVSPLMVNAMTPYVSVC